MGLIAIIGILLLASSLVHKGLAKEKFSTTTGILIIAAVAVLSFKLIY